MSADPIATNAWTHPRTGQVRHYVADIADAIGLDIARYKSGNIRGARVGGEGISNAEAGRILAARIWFDDAGVATIGPDSARTDIAALLDDAVKARGLDFLA